jgi:hypothetical protein
VAPSGWQDHSWKFGEFTDVGGVAAAVWNGSDVQEASTRGWNGLGNDTKRHDLSMGNDQTTTNTDLSLQAPRATTTSAPLPHGNALVTYPNLRQEKKCAGKKCEYEVMRDINVVNA